MEQTPLSRADVERRLSLGDRDFRGLDLTDADLSDLTIEDVVFGEGRRGRETANLTGVSFRGATLLRCGFVRCVLTDVDMGEATVARCDLRYAVCERVNLGGSTFADCDFYRAVFESACILDVRAFNRVSLNRASFSGVIGLRRTHVEGDALIQWDDAAYEAFLLEKEQDRPKGSPVTHAVAERHLELADTMRSLSGMWASQGHNGDAGWAYAISRDCERIAASPHCTATPTHYVHWLSLWAAKLSSGYGLSVGRVVGWLVVLAVVPGLVYALAGGVTVSERPSRTLLDTLRFSIDQMTGADAGRLEPGTPLVEWFSAGQFVTGVLLLGLLGFVLGNAIRSS